MTHEEDEVRRALEARSAAPSPEFRARLSQSLGTRPAAANLMPAIAIVTVLVLTVTSVGVLLAARQLGRTHDAAASGARTESPSPGPVGGFAFQLSAPSAGVVWALYDPDKLYRSTDQGSTWEIRSMPKDFGGHAMVSFLNDREGWWLAAGAAASQCLTESAAVWHTTDGGATWQQLAASGIAPAQCKNGIWFFDAKHGLVSAWDPNHQPTIYRTGDGGNSWTAAVVPDPAYFKSAPGGFTLQVDWIKELGGSIYMEAFGSQDDPNLPHDNQFILKSADGGASWAYVTKVPSRAIVMVTETRWLDFTTPGQAMESTNGGQQFHQFASDLTTLDPNAMQFVFVDANVGYAASPGRLQRTVDGGSHWSVARTPGAAPSLTPSPSASPSSIPMPSDAVLSAPSPTVVWAFVGSTSLFRSIDQGKTWQPLPWEPYPGGSGTPPILSFIDDAHGWVYYPETGACSQAGALWHTSDGAETWQGLAAATVRPNDPNGFAYAQCKNYMAVVDSTHGFIASHSAGQHPIINRSADGGLTWAQSTLPDPPGFTTDGGHALEVFNIREFGPLLLAVANDGGRDAYVFRSVDAGATWTYLAAAPSGSLQLSLVTETRWLIIGNAGHGSETTDAGQSWHSFTCDYRSAAGVASTFVFATAEVGYANDRGGVWRTVDGGAHWELIKTSWP